MCNPDWNFVRPLYAAFLVAISIGCTCFGLPAVGATGTGFFVSTNGFVLTCYHVIEGATSVQIRDYRGTLTDARVVNVDRKNDLALLETQRVSAALPISPVGGLRRGTEVITVGYPLVGLQGQESKVTNGIVSSLSGLGNDPTTLQITTPIQPGNSGGPLVNLEGNVVGVISHKLNAIAAARLTGDVPQNVNYAIKGMLAEQLARTSPRVQTAMPRPRQQRFNSVADLAEFVDRATVMVVAESRSTVVPPTAESLPPREPPRPPRPDAPTFEYPDENVYRLAGFRFRDHTSNGEVLVTEVFRESVRLAVGDVITCAYRELGGGGAVVCDQPKASSATLREIFIAADSGTSPAARRVILKIRREAEELWRSIPVVR